MKKHTTPNGAIIWYKGSPNSELLDQLASQEGDAWHSGHDFGYASLFSEIKYLTAIFWWYGLPFLGLQKSICWRIPFSDFAIRDAAWQLYLQQKRAYDNPTMQGLDLGYFLLKNAGGIPLYVKDLFANTTAPQALQIQDMFRFFRYNAKASHAYYFLLRKGFWKPAFWKAFWQTQKISQKAIPHFLPAQIADTVIGKPTVSYILPTMRRQQFTHQLLSHLAQQTYLPTEVIVIDATPETERETGIYETTQWPFDLKIIWQTSKGSCRARNEGLAISSGEYIIFGDDDVLFHQDFVANHLLFLQAYQAKAANGLDIRADHPAQTIADLDQKLLQIAQNRYKAGATAMFSNANSCIHRSILSFLPGNDVNFDGGYGEDGDFGLSIAKNGVSVLHNPFAANLHLKPAQGGYRWWGQQASKKGKLRKQQPWEGDFPVKNITPVPSPTVLYGIIKHFPADWVREYTIKHFVFYFTKGPKKLIFWKLMRLPYKILQYKKAFFYANNLLKKGTQYH